MGCLLTPRLRRGFQADHDGLGLFVVDDGLAAAKIDILVEPGGQEKHSANDKIIEEIRGVTEKEPAERAEERSIDKKADDIGKPVDMDLGFSRDKGAGERDLGIAQEKDLHEQDRSGKPVKAVQERGLPSPEIALEHKHKHEERDKRQKKDRFPKTGEKNTPP